MAEPEVKEDAKANPEEEGEEGSDEEDKEDLGKLYLWECGLLGKGGKEAKEGKVKNQDLNWVFAADRDERGKPYYQDGNPLLYTDENLKKRADLRKDPMVVEAIQEVTSILSDLA